MKLAEQLLQEMQFRPRTNEPREFEVVAKNTDRETFVKPRKGDIVISDSGGYFFFSREGDKSHFSHIHPGFKFRSRAIDVQDDWRIKKDDFSTVDITADKMGKAKLKKQTKDSLLNWLSDHNVKVNKISKDAILWNKFDGGYTQHVDK